MGKCEQSDHQLDRDATRVYLQISLQGGPVFSLTPFGVYFGIVCLLANLIAYFDCLFLSFFVPLRIVVVSFFLRCLVIFLIIIIQKIFVARTYPPCWVIKAPFSFTISVLGYFTCITQHTGRTAIGPIRRTKQLWLSVMLKDTGAATGQAGIRIHILTTPELESNTLDRSALTLQ